MISAYNRITTIECRHEGQRNLLNHKANLVSDLDYKSTTILKFVLSNNYSPGRFCLIVSDLYFASMSNNEICKDNGSVLFYIKQFI